MKSLTFKRLVLAFLMSCIVGHAFGERADRDKPISLSSEKAFFDDVKQIYILEVNVLLIKGTMVIKGEKADVKIDPEGYQVATVFAKPGTLASLRQKRDTGNDEYIEGYGEWIQYDGKTETATLVGNAKMNQLVGTKIFDKVAGEKIHYDAVTEKYKALSSTDVKSMLSPRRKDPSGNIKQ
jgi:lipopolysaccharide export system protein LptA